MDEIVIVEYDPCWPSLFEAEKAKLQKVLDTELVVSIEHIGSTAVLGLAAKPIIDLMVVIRSLNVAKQAVPLLEKLDYVYWHDNPDSNRLFFVKGLPPYDLQRTHHIHMVEAESKFCERSLFRDYLRIHLDEAKRYEALKRDLAVRFRSDREGYTNGKSEYIQTVMAQARQWQSYEWSQ
ncbi:MAG: GrpB family protein [Trichocoleus desertorum ATA4-8-CV12]|jgi:GrpB-like predicted nucleotidyltransferase (UPF0157 family)|nr:GrpB family protein [Trichocoleus desertorum ATA4-8-CV12]